MAGKPMTGQAFFVLTALAGGPRHGYGIVGEVEGLIEADREEAHDGRLRRYYRLTRDGRRALAEEAEVHAAAARAVRARLGLTGPAAAGAAG